MWNAAWDIWVNSSPDSPDENDDTEIMVWANQQGGPSPIGNKVATITVEGRAYDVWKGAGPGGTDVVSYVDVQTTTTPDIPLAPFLEDSVERGATSPDSYMTSVQFGFEPWKGGEGLAVDDFTYSPTAEQPARPTSEPKEAMGDPTLTSGGSPKSKRPDDGYDQVAAGDDPALLITEQAPASDAGKSGGNSGGQVLDLADPDREVTVHGDVGTTTTPNGSPAAVLAGQGDYLEVADSPDLSIPTTGQLPVEMLIRPDVVADLPGAQGSSDGPMVAPLVKGSTFGEAGDQEYAMRVYDQDSSRPSRTSAYAFDPAGGQGAGSYAQQELEEGQWVHLAAIYDTKAKGGDGWGTVTLFRDGAEVDADTLGGDHEITPADAGSPLFIGGDGARSAFTGAIGPVAIYPTALSDKQVKAHADAALTPDASHGKDTGKDTGKADDGQQEDEPETGARPIPIPTEKAGATS